MPLLQVQGPSNTTGILVLQLVMAEIGAPSHTFTSCNQSNCFNFADLPEYFFSNLYLNSYTRSSGSCQ